MQTLPQRRPQIIENKLGTLSQLLTASWRCGGSDKESRMCVGLYVCVCVCVRLPGQLWISAINNALGKQGLRMPSCCEPYEHTQTGTTEGIKPTTLPPCWKYQDCHCCGVCFFCFVLKLLMFWQEKMLVLKLQNYVEKKSCWVLNLGKGFGLNLSIPGRLSVVRQYCRRKEPLLRIPLS